MYVAHILRYAWVAWGGGASLMTPAGCKIWTLTCCSKDNSVAIETLLHHSLCYSLMMILQLLPHKHKPEFLLHCSLVSFMAYFSFLDI